MKFLIQLFKANLRKYYEIYFLKKKIKFDDAKKSIFVMLSATYENLGDIAITLNQIKYLKENFGEEYQIIEIPVENTYKYYLSMKKDIKENSIITLIGGGNDGSLYDFIEGPRLFLLNKFRKNIIISFPQSVFYENNFKGKYYKNKFIKSANKCSNLTIIARENKSYNSYSNLSLNCKILLTPDIVFYTKDIIKENKRNGVIFIMRDDKEKKMSYDVQNEIIDFVKSNDIELRMKDTCDIKINNSRKEILDNWCKDLSKSKLAITDRLHGMILCYITNTPCIVFDNNNGKIGSTYNTWLTKQNFIKLISDNISMDEFIKTFNELYNLNELKKEDLNVHYNKILEYLKKEID